MYDMSQISDMVGLAGVVLLLVSYFLLNAGKLSSLNITYQLMNFFSSWLILFSLWYHWNTASVLIEIAWILISVLGMKRALAAKRTNISSL